MSSVKILKAHGDFRKGEVVSVPFCRGRDLIAAGVAKYLHAPAEDSAIDTEAAKPAAEPEPAAQPEPVPEPVPAPEATGEEKSVEPAMPRKRGRKSDS